MCDLDKISKAADQSCSMFTCDQQLFGVILNVTWANPPRSVEFVPEIGGMHWIVSLLGLWANCWKILD